MKFLFISQTGDGLGVASRLRVEGHEVAMWIKSPAYKMSGLGIMERPISWREKLRWADCVVCEMVGHGQYEESLRAIGKPYLCCSPVMDLVELDRSKGMEIFKKVGIKTPKTEAFENPKEARKFFEGMDDWKDGYCIKADGNIGCDTTKIVKEPEALDWVFGLYPSNCPILVQDIVKGIEVSTEGWWNGKDWIRPFNHTFEEKRFLEGDLGPNTGCMGNVVVARDSNKLTRATVERLAPLLKRTGWRGPVDVNCIVNEEGAFGLEATCRFGYDAVEALLEGARLGAGDFLWDVARGAMSEMDITPDTMMAVRLSVPPYPMEDVEAPKGSWGEPILGINENNINHLWLCNVFVEDNLFKVADADGVVLKATARGPRKGDDLVGSARDRVYRTLSNIKLGSKQYRLDIGKRVNTDFKALVDMGWIQG